MMTISQRFTDSKPYDSGYQVGVECHKRLHTAYKGKFLKLKKNKAGAKGKTDDQIDQAVEKLLAEQLCDSPVPYTVSADIARRLHPGCRHDLYSAFREPPRGSPVLVRY